MYIITAGPPSAKRPNHRLLCAGFEWPGGKRVLEEAREHLRVIDKVVIAIFRQEDSAGSKCWSRREWLDLDPSLPAEVMTPSELLAQCPGLREFRSESMAKDRGKRVDSRAGEVAAKASYRRLPGDVWDQRFRNQLPGSSG